MSASYVVADLVRNPRRSLSTMVGIVLGVGLFCGVLFFVDGLSASMTQRAVAPLPLDMQRIVTQRAAAAIELSQSFTPAAVVAPGDRVEVALQLRNDGETHANEVTVRSRPIGELVYVPGSAMLDGRAIDDAASGDPTENPFAQGPARSGYNVGRILPGETLRFTYIVEATTAVDLDDTTIVSSYSSRESVSPIAANQPLLVSLDELARQIADQRGVATANSLSIADLGSGALTGNGRTAAGPAKIFGFDAGYLTGDRTIEIVEGSFEPDGALLSAEAAIALGSGVGDRVTISLPDYSSMEVTVAGVVDLSRARSLFSSRRGGDLETFIYTPHSVIVGSTIFAESVFPAFERAAADADSRLKSPPIREVDITLDRELLNADPSTAVVQTEQIASGVMAVAEHQDYLLDNISNTLNVAAADAAVAKRLFVFLGLPGGLLAAMLAAYAGNVLAEAQRREQATLRIRGASRSDLLRMLALRTAMLTGAGSLAGLTAGYLAAVAILGRGSLDRASTSSLVTSGAVGAVGGFLATGSALYLTGRRSIEREINDDRARLASHRPLWRRARLDLVAVAIVAVGTVLALRADAFAGASGSVYFGRSVDLNLRLLVLPVAVWIAGSLVAARVVGGVLHRSRPASNPALGSVLLALVRRSLGRRPWAISNGAIIASLIVALVTSLGAFTASYDEAKTVDARYANGADVRITPSPTAQRRYTIDDGDVFRTASIAETSPIIHGLSNVILRSDRTSDPANLVAVDPPSYVAVAPVDAATAERLAVLVPSDDTILVSAEMADFLKVGVGDTLHVLLGRATPDQTEIEVRIADLYERLPGFPDGADAVMNIHLHTAAVPAKAPDFFLAATVADDNETLAAAVDELRAGPATLDQLQVDTRASTLDRDQSSLAALNIAGLVDLDLVFALAMATVTVAIFVFGLLLQRRREYVTLRAQGVERRLIRLLIVAEAATVAVTGTVAGVMVGAVMGYYFVAVLRPLFVLDPAYSLPLSGVVVPTVLVLAATVVSAIGGSRLVNSLDPTELLRDD